LKEIKAPHGFVLSTTKYPFSITTNNETIQITADNKAQLTQLTIIKKTDATGAKLYGAVFEILDSDMNLIETLTCPEDANHVTSSNLSLGKYYIREKVAPVGYVLNTELIEINLAYGSPGTVINSAVKEIKNELITGNFKLTKVDTSDSEQHLQGAEYRIWGISEHNSDFDEVFTTNESGEIFIENLKFGQYKYQELKAPDGYILEDIEGTFDISVNEELVTRTAVNEKIPKVPDIPETGDNSNVIFSVVAIVSVAFIVMIAKKKKVYEI